MGNNRRKRNKYVFLVFGLCVLVFGLANEAKSKEKILSVVVEITAPCVMHYDSTYTGFDIELWEEIAQEVVIPAKSIDQAYEKLLKGEVNAVVFDSPIILYYARNKGAGKVSVVGPLFDLQYYGFLFPQGSELREPVNRALLKLRTNGIYDKLYSKWFGSK